MSNRAAAQDVARRVRDSRPIHERFNTAIDNAVSSNISVEELCEHLMTEFDLEPSDIRQISDEFTARRGRRVGRPEPGSGIPRNPDSRNLNSDIDNEQEERRVADDSLEGASTNAAPGETQEIPADSNHPVVSGATQGVFPSNGDQLMVVSSREKRKLASWRKKRGKRPEHFIQPIDNDPDHSSDSSSSSSNSDPSSPEDSPERPAKKKRRTEDISNSTSSILSFFPRLAEISKEVVVGKHLKKTWEIRQFIEGQKSLDQILSYVQGVPLRQALSRSIWKKIIEDQYVPFDKLYGSFDSGHNANDLGPEIVKGSGLRIIKSDQEAHSRPIVSQSDWSRVFDAWRDGVLVFYGHRSNELEKYRLFVTKMFETSPSPSMATATINFDQDVRHQYAASPFRMDKTNVLLVYQQRHLTRTTLSHLPPAPSKKQSSRPPVKKKVDEEICLNWNLGFCSLDPCHNGRIHGTCSECGAFHKACDESKCDSTIQSKRRSRTAYASRNATGSGGRSDRT